MIDEVIGRHFWLSEFLRSDLATRSGIANVPGPADLGNIRSCLGPGMERVRNALGVPVLITSGFRCAALNQRLGSSSTSQHCVGLAADFIAPQFGTPRAIAKYLMERSGEIRFDQLIFEGTWVHISFVPGAPRSEVLTAHFGAGPVTYTRGLA